MNPLKFIKAVSKTYFAERDKIRNRSKRWWSLTLIVFFSLYLFQIYAAYMDWQMVIVRQAIDTVSFINPEEFWQNKVGGIYLQGIVLFGFLVRFLAGQFRGRWLIRVGELGELLAFAAFVRHLLWTQEIYSKVFDGNGCGAPALIGLVPHHSQFLAFFFFCWIIYKTLWIIAVMWETVRK